MLTAMAVVPVRTTWLPSSVLVPLVLVGAACDPVERVTYADAKPIVDVKCATCHHAGGIGPFPMTTFDEVKTFASIARDAVARGSMPPWPAQDGCDTYVADRSLTEHERETLLTFFAEPVAGDVDDAGVAFVPLPPVIRRDLVLEAEGPFHPEADDAYRCYALAWPMDEAVAAIDGGAEDTGDAVYITGFDVLPGAPDNVHHVNVFLSPPAIGGAFVRFDEQDDAAGYDCERGARDIGSALIGAWAPGASGFAYPSGTGQLVEPGSVVTLEVHYARGGAAAPDDTPSLALELARRVDKRGLGAAFWSFFDWDAGNMLIPAGAKRVRHGVDFDPNGALQLLAPWWTARAGDIHAVSLHMHRLGAGGNISLSTARDADCLLDVPRWDFHWQLAYTLEKPAPFVLGEHLFSLECAWDNSAENQPVIDGVRQAPRDVNWGNRTSDEMCMGFLYLTPSE
jgi:hypothetical protein